MSDREHDLRWLAPVRKEPVEPLFPEQLQEIQQELARPKPRPHAVRRAISHLAERLFWTALDGPAGRWSDWDDLVEMLPIVERGWRGRRGARDGTLAWALALAELSGLELPPAVPTGAVATLLANLEKSEVGSRMLDELAWLALYAGAYDIATELGGGGKPPKRFRPGLTFPWDVGKVVSYLVAARRDDASLDDVLPAWRCLMDNARRKLELDELTLGALLFGSATIHVHFRGGSAHTVWEFFQAERRARQAPAAAALEWPEDLSPWQAQLEPLVDAEDWQSAVVAGDGAIHSVSWSCAFLLSSEREMRGDQPRPDMARLASLGLLAQLSTPPRLSSHLELAADALRGALAPYKRLPGNRATLAAGPMSLLELMRVFDVPRPPDRMFPKSGWIDALLEYSGPVPAEDLVTAMLALAATGGAERLEAAADAAEAAAEAAGANDDGRLRLPALPAMIHGHTRSAPEADPVAAFLGAFVEGRADARDLGLDALAHVPKVTSGMRLLDAIWLAEVIAVQLDGDSVAGGAKILQSLVG